MKVELTDREAAFVVEALKNIVGPQKVGPLNVYLAEKIILKLVR